ncbi:hypothetical protein DFS34DRAFT_704761 [Phlyctochytrium arcticum]|nr:hypothetical protein DFS34DRAFT_704761 [Phlyctochytrium arcticum]
MSKATFSPYRPPEPSPHLPSPASPTSYQSGGVPSSSSVNNPIGASLPPVNYGEGSSSSLRGGGSSSGGGGPAERVNKWETSLRMRVDLEAAGCYVLGPVSGALFLILEQKNDYVRFHAWQSCLAFTALLAAQFLFGILTLSKIVWLIFIAELALVGWCGYQAYTNSDTLARYQLPYVGEIACNWVDNE